MDLHPTGLSFCQFTSLDILPYRFNLYTQAQTALSELEAILSEVCDESTKSTITWGERMERQEESWEEFRHKIMGEFLKHSYLSEDCVSLSQTNACALVSYLPLTDMLCLWSRDGSIQVSPVWAWSGSVHCL